MPDQTRRKRRPQEVNLSAVEVATGNKPPSAPDVEEAVLGAMLIEPTTIDEAM